MLDIVDGGLEDVCLVWCWHFDVVSGEEGNSIRDTHGFGVCDPSSVASVVFEGWS